MFFLSRSFFLNGRALVTNSSPCRVTRTVNRTPVEKECSSLGFVYCHYILTAKRFFPSANALVFPELLLRMVLRISVSYFHTFPFTHMLCVVLWVLLEGEARSQGTGSELVSTDGLSVRCVEGRGPRGAPETTRSNSASTRRCRAHSLGKNLSSSLAPPLPLPPRWVSGHRPFCERTAWGRQSEPTTP